MTPPTTPTLLDSASLGELAYLFDSGRPMRRYTWAYQCAYESTCLLLSCKSIRIAPGVRLAKPSGVHGRLRSRLASLIHEYRAKKDVTDLALDETRLWALRPENQAHLARYVDFGPLVDAGISEALGPFVESHKEQWYDVAAERGELFDEMFIEAIASTLDVSPDELSRLHSLIRREPHRLMESGEGLGSYGSDLASSAYLVSILLRGYLHDAYARLENVQVLHHPYRTIFLENGAQPSGSLSFGPSNSVRAVASILIEGSMRQRSAEARVEHYCNSMEALLRAVRQGRLNLRQADDDEIALRDSADAFVRLGIRTHSPASDQWLDYLFGGAVNWLTSFHLVSWESFVAGMAGAAISAKFSIGSRAADKLLERPQRLARLGRHGPGRLVRRGI
jgi:hypothetical protein